MANVDLRALVIFGWFDWAYFWGGVQLPGNHFSLQHFHLSAALKNIVRIFESIDIQN